MREFLMSTTPIPNWLALLIAALWIADQWSAGYRDKLVLALYDVSARLTASRTGRHREEGRDGTT